MIEKEIEPVGKDNEEKKISQMVGINQVKVIIVNFKRSLEVGGEIIIKISGGGVRPRAFSIRGEMLSLQVI